LLYIEADGHCLLVPDNGCWTELAHSLSGLPVARRLSEPCYWRTSVSATFHGRDILAPVAGWLSRGLNPEKLGPLVSEWIQLQLPAPKLTENRLSGEVVFIDHYGNLISNIPGEPFAILTTRPVRITIAGQEINRRVRTYAEADPGTLVALVSSSGRLEVAVVQGNAAQRLTAKIGDPVIVTAQD
jgi:S-adenosylmethionine hydrolase